MFQGEATDTELAIAEPLPGLENAHTLLTLTVTLDPKQLILVESVFFTKEKTGFARAK